MVMLRDLAPKQLCAVSRNCFAVHLFCKEVADLRVSMAEGCASSFNIRVLPLI